MAKFVLEDTLKQYPELRLEMTNEYYCRFKDNQKNIIVARREADLYARTYIYCKALIKLDRVEAAKDIAFNRNEYSNLPFDRLPFLALLYDMGHLIEAVKLQPMLEIVPKVKGKKVSFFYEEANKHLQVKPGFVGHHLQSNFLCEQDIKKQAYNNAVLRSVSTPLSSQLIAVYDAHVQCCTMIQDFDYTNALSMVNQYGLHRDIKQEYTDFIMPYALEFRHLYSHQSQDSAFNYARENGFDAVIRNGKLVTLERNKTRQKNKSDFNRNPDLADVPILHYAISEADNSMIATLQ